MKLNEQERELVENNMGLVNVHIKRFVGVPRTPTRQREYDDLFQEGCLALMESAKSYDAGRHGPFAAYALPRIHHAVSIALYERFATVRVPAKSVKRAKQRLREDPERHRPEPALADTHNFSHDGQIRDRRPTDRHRPASAVVARRTAGVGEGMSLGMRLRAKYEAAVREAARRIVRGGRGRKDRKDLVARFVEERLLIPDPESQTAKRQLARDFGCSIGRVQSCEESLKTEIRSLLEADAEFSVLLRVARTEDTGIEAPLDPSTKRKCREAAGSDFGRRLGRLVVERQALILHDLVLAVLGRPTGVAGRLFGRLDDAGRVRLLGMLLDEERRGKQQGQGVRAQRPGTSESSHAARADRAASGTPRPEA